MGRNEEDTQWEEKDDEEKLACYFIIHLFIYISLSLFIFLIASISNSSLLFLLFLCSSKFFLLKLRQTKNMDQIEINKMPLTETQARQGKHKIPFRDAIFQAYSTSLASFQTSPIQT